MPSRTRWPNFRRSEFMCSCGCGTNNIIDEFIDILQEMRTTIGEPFIITSGYRCEENPREAAKRHPGAHFIGVAADIACDAALARRILQLATANDRITGIGISQISNKRFVHLDMSLNQTYRPRPALWTYVPTDP